MTIVEEFPERQLRPADDDPGVIPPAGTPAEMGIEIRDLEPGQHRLYRFFYKVLAEGRGTIRWNVDTNWHETRYAQQLRERRVLVREAQPPLVRHRRILPPARVCVPGPCLDPCGRPDPCCPPRPVRVCQPVIDETIVCEQPPVEYEVSRLEPFEVAQTACLKDAASGWSHLTTQGIPGILLELVDLDDGVKIENGIVYQVDIVNQGTATLRDIGLTIARQPNVQIVSVEYKGRTYPIQDPNTQSHRSIYIHTVRGLRPHDRAVFKFRTRILKPGSYYFGASISGADLPSGDVAETENSTVY